MFDWRVFLIAPPNKFVGRERRERLSQLAWCGGRCFDSRRRVNSDVGVLHFDMSRTYIRTASLILVVIVGCVAGARSQRKAAASKSPCPDDRAWTGRYRNYVYGFSIVIPRGLKGYWNSARCAPDEKLGCVC